MRQAFGPPSRYPYSAAVRAGDFVYVSGQVPVRPDGTLVGGEIGAQTRQAMDNVRDALAAAGCTLDDIVKVGVFLTEPSDFASFNEAYTTYFSAPPPARSTVCIRLVVDARIEIEAIAYKPEQRA